MFIARTVLSSFDDFAEPPEVPFGVKVLDKSGRSVQLSWSAPYDGNSPITRYLIEYKVGLLKNWSQS